MSPLPIYVWKEWREQRGTLCVLAAAFLAGVGAVTAALPRHLVCDPIALQGIVALVLLATIISVGSDLLARERAGAGLGFLERLPAGLGTAFRAKLVFLVLALAGAALYGGLLATGVALMRTGESPQGLLEAAPWLLAVMVSVSLWVFAVSAWMPASALTFPGTLLLLAAFAWPAVLAIRGDAPFKPTPNQGLVFVLLCVAGAPVSAWAAFVVGSRLGRTRRRAALAGLSVAALFFAPSWVWAAGRYASWVNPPFEVQHGWVGPNGRYAFLDLTRRPPQGVKNEEARDWERRSTALLVDLESGTWTFAGEVDDSVFVRSNSRRRIASFNVDEERMPVRLISDREQGNGNAEVPVFLDPLSASVLSADELRDLPAPRIGPMDFGLEAEPKGFYSIDPAGLGQRLRYREDKRDLEVYLDADGRIVDGASLPTGKTGRPLFDVRVRRGRWIARDVHDWVWLDPSTGEHAPLEHLKRKDRVGPLLADGRIVLTSPEGVVLLDPDSGARTALRVIGDAEFEIRGLDDNGFLQPPLPVNTPCVVLVSSRREMRVALLDVAAGSLKLGPSSGGCRMRLLLCAPSPWAIVLEDQDRVVRYDVASGKREVLFTVDALL
jgi:hypothetical protein